MADAGGAKYSLSVEVTARSTAGEAWDLLVDPGKLGRLFWGSTVESDFKAGSSIVWKGMWEGKPFEDKGTITKREERSLLQCTHWSPTSGTPDEDAYRHLLTFRLAPEKGGVRITLQHENIPTLAMKEHSEGMWNDLLGRMKAMLEEAESPR
jgi:hypothetical protein